MGVVGSLFVVLAVAQNAPGQAVGYDIEELHPIPPLPNALPAPLSSLPAPAHEAAEPSGGGYGITYRDDGGFTADAGTFRAHVDPEGRVRFEDESLWVGFSQLTIFGRFGLGSDPNAYAKRGFLEETFEQRLAMRAAIAEGAMDAALAELPRYLATVWRYAAWPEATRKRVLFELWDECAEWGNPQLLEGGREARAIITEFIRRYLPPDSDAAFSPRELAALNNERTSAEPFRPYVLSSGAEDSDERSQLDSHPHDVSLLDRRVR